MDRRAGTRRVVAQIVTQMVETGNQILIAILLAAVGFGCSDAKDERRASPHPNVLLVVIDSLRADHLGSYGYARDTSPSLDRLAREGARFETAVAPTSWSLPSLVTLFTALPPEQHGVVHPDLALGDEALTLAEVLNERGFATAAFVTGHDFERSRGLAQGFDTYIEREFEAEAPASANGSSQPVAEVDSWLIRWDEAGRKRPFFVFVHLPLPQNGEALRAPFDGMFRLEGPEALEIEQVIARYDAGIRHADHQFGQIVQRLNALDLRRETLVVVTSNHGEEFLERGNLGHGETLHGESVRIPLIVRFPSRLDAGRVIPQPARLMDIGATILMLARVRRPVEFGFSHITYGFSMRDLTELLLGEPIGKHVVLGGDLAGKSQSLRLRSYKLIRHLAPDGADRYEFFNLELDPNETNDLSELESKRVGFYATKLEAWRKICAERPQYARPHRSAGG